MARQGIDRAAIAEAAYALAEERGLAGLGIRSVAEACGVSVGSIYNYFDSKADLVGAAVESVWREIFHLPEDGTVFRDTQACVAWMYERMEQGCRFVTTVEPLREALLMPGVACWHEEGRFIAVDQDDGEDEDGGAAYEGDEVRVLKIPAHTETATLLFDPRDIDFAESMNKATYLSVRGERYQTPRTMDELEHELSRAGFFRCHRSFLVNVQKVAKVERYTRNSFNLTLGDAAHTSIPLAKGRADEMRERYRW